MARGLRVEPVALQTVTVDLSQGSSPEVSYTATYNGSPVSAGWDVDRGELAVIGAGPSSGASLMPRGRAGGLVRVRAVYRGEVVEREVLIQLVQSHNGVDSSSPDQQRQVPTSQADLKAGGGVGGVGGEGLGDPVEDSGLLERLQTPTADGSAQGLHFLYPYDGTVWPRGMLAPLLMWDSDLGSADAIRIDLETTSGSFRWSGSYAPPAILAETKGAFTRHPIPQDVWTRATDSAGGAAPEGGPDRLRVSLTVAKGAEVYGPLTQTWTVAPARLTGTIYYSSYGTNLAKNYTGAKGGDGTFGGAVLSIRVGDVEPQLVAGTDGPSKNCRVCHSVSADGSRLSAVWGDHSGNGVYPLSPMGVGDETKLSKAEYPGLTGDGRYSLAPNGTMLDLEDGGKAVSVQGLSEVSTNLGTPSFSFGNDRLVFNPMASSSLENPTRKIVTMDFDVSTLTFSNPLTLVDNTGEPAEVRPGWPAFSPDGSVVFHQQTAAGVDGNGQGALHTRKGAKAYLAWTPGGEMAAFPLRRLNGEREDGSSYLPQLAAPMSLACTGDGAQVGGINADHADDVHMNYEPTVSPVASGGYAWVVFTSRRMYGSVADIPPYCSDPRGVDLITHITPKKLWVAALNLNGTPGTDISYPAFYLPAQELLAGNTRGSWVLDPCRADGDSCSTGDQCCNGYCSADGPDGSLICANDLPDSQCAQTQERCDVDADCCSEGDACLNGFCATVFELI